MNRRRGLLIALAASLAGPLRAHAQPSGRPRRIGVLLVTSRAHPGAERLLAPFLAGMRDRGYVEGGNLVIEWREADGRFERLPALAAELVALKVDIIVAGASDAAEAAKKATAEIPIVFVSSIDPIGKGLVKSFARPDTNATGFGTFAESLVGKRLESLREVVPRMSRLAVIHGPGGASEVTETRKVSAVLSVQPQIFEVRTEADLEVAFRAIERLRPEGLLVILDTVTYVHRGRIAQFALARRLPAVSSLAQFAEAGGLMSYSNDFHDNWRRAADYVDRILKGAKPADLPVQQPTKIELVVNLKTAREIGVTIPRSILLRADRVIE
jgi:putative ABC transport system substrate-binding protein